MDSGEHVPNGSLPPGRPGDDPAPAVPAADGHDAAATRFKIGMPPGMDAALDTVPSSDMAPPAPPVASVPSQGSVPVNRPEFGVAPVRMPSAKGSMLPPAPSPDPRLLLPDGTILPLGGGVIVGRDPQYQVGYGVTALARLYDVERSVSKTHAVIGISEGRVWVIDLNSTNGTMIVSPDGSEQQCPAEVATPVPRGSDLRFGEYLVRVAVG